METGKQGQGDNPWQLLFPLFCEQKSPSLAYLEQEPRNGNPYLLEIWFFKIVYKR